MSQEPLDTEIYRKNAVPQNRNPPLCASLRGRKACQDFTRATLYRNLQEKRRGQEPRPTLCASLRSRNACQDFTRATSDGNLQVKCCRPKPRRTLCASLRRRNACHKSHFARRFTGKTLGPATHTFCEPAKSKHMSRFHKSHSIRKFAGKMPQTRVSTLIKHRPLLLLL